MLDLYQFEFLWLPTDPTVELWPDQLMKGKQRFGGAFGPYVASYTSSKPRGFVGVLSRPTMALFGFKLKNRVHHDSGGIIHWYCPYQTISLQGQSWPVALFAIAFTCAMGLEQPTSKISLNVSLFSMFQWSLFSSLSSPVCTLLL